MCVSLVSIMANRLHEFMTGKPYSELERYRVRPERLALGIFICVVANLAASAWRLFG